MSIEERLIIEVESRPILWDKRSEHYKNRDNVREEWEQISTKLEKPRELVKNKWRNLRDTFQKELKKVPTPCSGDPGSPNRMNYTGRWAYFNDLCFLKGVMKPRETEGNTPEESPEIHEMPTVPSHENSSVGVVNSSSSLESRITNADSLTNGQQPNKKKRKTVSDISEFQRQMLEIEEKKIAAFQEKSKLDDDNMLFAKSLVPFLNTLSPVQKLRVRSKIQNLIADEMSASTGHTTNSTNRVPQLRHSSSSLEPSDNYYYNPSLNTP